MNSRKIWVTLATWRGPRFPWEFRCLCVDMRHSGAGPPVTSSIPPDYSKTRFCLHSGGTDWGHMDFSTRARGFSPLTTGMADSIAGGGHASTSRWFSRTSPQSLSSAWRLSIDSTGRQHSHRCSRKRWMGMMKIYHIHLQPPPSWPCQKENISPRLLDSIFCWHRNSMMWFWIWPSLPRLNLWALDVILISSLSQRFLSLRPR